jgi:uncharacterized protein
MRWIFSASIPSAMILCAIFLSVPARAASFDCAKAQSSDERAVCASRRLSEMDVEMAVRFETLTGLVAMGTRGDMGDAQRDFLKARAHCGANTACLTALYQARIAVLKNEYQSLKSRGPF